MKKSFQMIALLAVALLGACSGGKDKAVAEHVDEKPRVKLADVKARPVEQIHEYTATVEAEVKNNIAPSSPVRIDRILVEVGDRVSKGEDGEACHHPTLGRGKALVTKTKGNNNSLL